MQWIQGKHAGSDRQAFWLRPVMAITASVQPESGRTVYAGSDFLHPFQLRFSKEGMDHIVQNRPGSDLDGLVRVWSNTSGLDGLVRVWPNTSGLDGLVRVWPNTSGLDGLVRVWPNTSGLDGLVRVWPNTSGLDGLVRVWPNTSGLDGLVRVWPNTSGLEASWCAVSHFQTRFRSSADVPDNTVQNQPGSDSVLADCVSFWPNGSGPEASLCARIIRPASGQCFRTDPDRMRIGSGMFTG